MINQNNNNHISNLNQNNNNNIKRHQENQNLDNSDGGLRENSSIIKSESNIINN